MSRYTSQSIARRFQTLILKNKKGERIGTKTIRRSEKLLAPQNEFKKFADLPFPVRVSPGQIINLKKEAKRQALIK